MPNSAVPLSIPLHFQLSGRPQYRQGPVLPKDWRTKWRPEEPNTVSNASVKQTEESPTDQILEDWPDTDVKQWALCMTAWDARGDKGVVTYDEKFTSTINQDHRKTDTPQIAVADEYGNQVKDETNVPTTSAQIARYKAITGDPRGGRRVAVGLYDGSVWIFQENRPQSAVSTPLNEVNEKARVSSRSSFSFMPTASPPSVQSPTQTTRRADVESFTSPTAVSATTDVMASASPVKSCETDVEEKLEHQWHAGRERHSMVGGMMEALGLQETDHSHERSHGETTDLKAQNGSTSPRQKVRSGNERSSLRNLDNEERDTNNSEIAKSLAEAGLMSAIGIGGGRKNAGGAGIISHGSAHSTHAQSSSSRVGEEDAPPSASANDTCMIESLEPIILLQCPSDAPVVRIETLTSAQQDVLAILQADSVLTLCSLGETLTARSVDLKAVRKADEEPHDSSTSATSSLPFARLAALRSQTASPAPAMSRTNSSIPQSNTPNYSGARGNQFMNLIHENNSCKSQLIMCYDDQRKRIVILDSTGGIKVVQELDDIGEIPPSASVAPFIDYIEVFYINNRGCLQAKKVYINAQNSVNEGDAISDSITTPLSSASAFLRREGFSRPSSKPASVMEDSPETKQVIDLGDQGLASKARGLACFHDDLIVSWNDRDIYMGRRVGDSLISVDVTEKTNLRRILIHSHDILLLFDVSTNNSTPCKKELTIFRCQDRVEVLHISASGHIEKDTAQIFHLHSEIDTISALEGSSNAVLASGRTNDDRLVLYNGENVIWQGEANNSLPNLQITASLPLGMDRIVLCLCECSVQFLLVLLICLKADGHILMSSLSELVNGQLDVPAKNIDSYVGTVTLLQTIENTRTQAKLIFGGTEQGDIIIWNAADLTRLFQRSLLTSPIVSFIPIGHDDNALRLHGTVACVSADGTVAFISLDGLKE